MGNTYKKKPKTPKNINKEELQKLQAIVKSINEAQFYVGDLEIKKVRTIQNINGLTNQMNDYQNELKDKYGDVVVNITTGAIRPNENGEVNKED
tara:strand:- start:184 stop:465 length:282 start_codon:yes stop_codon:yes gene_type:complete